MSGFILFFSYTASTVRRKFIQQYDVECAGLFKYCAFAITVYKLLERKLVDQDWANFFDVNCLFQRKLAQSPEAKLQHLNGCQVQL